MTFLCVFVFLKSRFFYKVVHLSPTKQVCDRNPVWAATTELPLSWEAANLFTIFTVINKEKGKLAPASSTASATFAFCWDQPISYQTGEFLFLLLPEGAKCITGTHHGKTLV